MNWRTANRRARRKLIVQPIWTLECWRDQVFQRGSEER